MSTLDTQDWSTESLVSPAGTLTSSEVAVGTSAVRIVALGEQLAIALLADAANTGTVYIGVSSAVSSTDWPLASGAYLSLGVSTDVWVIASAAGQVLHVMQAGV